MKIETGRNLRISNIAKLWKRSFLEKRFILRKTASKNGWFCLINSARAKLQYVYIYIDWVTDTWSLTSMWMLCKHWYFDLFTIRSWQWTFTLQSNILTRYRFVIEWSNALGSHPSAFHGFNPMQAIIHHCKSNKFRILWWE